MAAASAAWRRLFSAMTAALSAWRRLFSAMTAALSAMTVAISSLFFARYLADDSRFLSG